jgi:hypothetical protein
VGKAFTYQTYLTYQTHLTGWFTAVRTAGFPRR